MMLSNVILLYADITSFLYFSIYIIDKHRKTLRKNCMCLR